MIIIIIIRAQHLTATAFIKPTHNFPPVSTGFAWPTMPHINQVNCLM